MSDDSERPDEDPRRTVLLVDDDRHVFEVVQRFLAGEGYDVAVADDGEQALAAMRTQLPDVLLLDLNLPKLNGFEVLDHMQREELRPAVVLAISGEADDETARASLELGVDEYIVKPFDLSYLKRAIRLRL